MWKFLFGKFIQRILFKKTYFREVLFSFWYWINSLLKCHRYKLITSLTYSTYSFRKYPQVTGEIDSYCTVPSLRHVESRNKIPVNINNTALTLPKCKNNTQGVNIPPWETLCRLHFFKKESSKRISGSLKIKETAVIKSVVTKTRETDYSVAWNALQLAFHEISDSDSGGLEELFIKHSKSNVSCLSSSSISLFEPK